MGNETDTARAERTPADRQETENFDDSDISQILAGSKAITGKAVWSANGAAAMQREDAAQRQQVEEKQNAAREARELAHLAEWNAQMTSLGGVAMTNAQAQEARQHIIDHADEYADRAVREGRIREDEREEYKRTARRIHELKEREGRGIMTDAERRECERLQQSAAGHAAEEDAGRYHAEKTHDQDMDARTTSATANESLRTGLPAAPVADNFQSAPKISGQFSGAVAGPNIALNIPPPDTAIRNNKGGFTPD